MTSRLRQSAQADFVHLLRQFQLPMVILLLACAPIYAQHITLSEAVDIALKNNPALRSSAAAVSAAGARVRAANSMTRLQLSTTTFATKASMPMIIGGAGNVVPQNLNLVPGDGRIGQNFMAMYPLYTGGLLSGEVRRAEALRSASASDAVSTQLDVALAAKVAFYGVLAARAYADAYQKRVEESKERVRIAEDAYKEGRIAKFDLLRNQTDLAEAEQMLVDAQRDIDIALADLKNVMGVSQSCDYAPSGELLPRDFDQPFDTLEALAIKQRPEVAAARAKVRSAESGVGVAKSAYRPQIYATGMQDVAGTQRDGFDQGYLVGITAAIPILDGGSRKSAVDESRAMVEQAAADERTAELAVARDVAAQIAELKAETRKVALSQASVDQAEEDYRVVKLRYESGKAINVEVLDALASLTRARTNYAEALYRHNVAREKLTRAVGSK